MIFKGLKPRRLKPYGGKWVKELSSVLWTLCTTLSRATATGHTLFSLVYISEAMLPMEVEHKSFHMQHFNKEQSDDFRVDDLTRLEELCEATVIQSAKHQKAIRMISRAEHLFTQFLGMRFHTMKDPDD
jgi:hypothetical protein